jgi:hypothetical protein
LILAKNALIGGGLYAADEALQVSTDFHDVIRQPVISID